MSSRRPARRDGDDRRSSSAADRPLGALRDVVGRRRSRAARRTWRRRARGREAPAASAGEATGPRTPDFRARDRRQAVILYLDTSALVKLYVDEPGRERVEAAVRNAERIATVRVTYAEARAAFARQRRERAITARDLRTLVRALDEDWASLAVVEVTEASVRAAGDLAERHALRAYDALQLAAAVQLHAEGATVAFCSFDVRLSRAARRQRLTLA
ncbi:MAG: type II toxin-antitoxin system VapC family toxin [Deltaproteobacteria bacterium]|nr:MAG: type II toxin-antitoxin system VapC family toxin [Deltaproteobacteria bacterium]